MTPIEIELMENHIRDLNQEDKRRVLMMFDVEDLAYVLEYKSVMTRERVKSALEILNAKYY